MAKKTTDVKKLALAIRPALVKRRGNPSPVRQEPPAQYRFTPGVSGNPSGRPREYAMEISGRMMRSSPPKALCEEIGVDSKVSWGEAIMYALSSAAARGDVSAAREVLAALGFSGTSAKNLMAVSVEGGARLTPEYIEIAKAMADVLPEYRVKVLDYARSLSRPLELTADCFPPVEPKQLTEGTE